MHTRQDPIGRDAIRVMATCVRLTNAGCRVRSAHTHWGIPVVVVDRRPPLDCLRPISLRAGRDGADYRALLHGVNIAWHEGQTNINGVRP